MTRLHWGTVSEQILEALAECGPMHAGELGQMVAGTDSDVRKALTRMAQISKRGPSKGLRRAHVTHWVWDFEGARDYPRPVYKLGHGRNVPKPPPRARKDVVRQWAQKVRKHQTHNFVFNLGL